VILTIEILRGEIFFQISGGKIFYQILRTLKPKFSSLRSSVPYITEMVSSQYTWTRRTLESKWSKKTCPDTY